MVEQEAENNKINEGKKQASSRHDHVTNTPNGQGRGNRIQKVGAHDEIS